MFATAKYHALLLPTLAVAIILLMLAALLLGYEPARAQSGAPTVSAVAVTSDAGDDDTYLLGDVIQVTLTFSQAVNVTGSPELAIDMDPADWGEKQAAYESGSGSATLTFTHTVVEPNLSTQGIAVLGDSLTLNGGSIKSASSQTDADLSHAGLAHDANHKVDWQQASPAPSVSSVAITSDAGDDDTYGKDDVIEITLTFSEAVDVTGTPQLDIDMDPADWGEKQAAYHSGGGSTALTFTHTVVEPNLSTQGIAVLADSLELNGGTIQSATSHTNANLAHTGLDHDAQHKVDWQQAPSAPSPTPTPTPTPASDANPTITAVAVSSDAGRDDTYGYGDVIEVTLTFSEAVDVTGSPHLSIDMDPADWGTKQASYHSGAGTTGLVFTHTVVEPNLSTQGIAVLADTLALNGGTIQSDASDTDADLSHPGLGHDAGHKVDWEAPPDQPPGVPWVTGVAITSDPGDDDTYIHGETIQVTATFSETVNVDTTGGTPQLKIRMAPQLWWKNLDNAERQTSYVSGSGTSELIFEYTVAAVNRTTYGVAVLKNTLVLNGGTIRSTAAAPVNAHLRYKGLWHDPNHRVDGTAPALLGVAVSGTKVAVTFGEALDGASVPSASAFTVKRTPQGGAEEAVSLSGSPAIAGGAVLLTLADPIVGTDTDVKVSYAKPTAAGANKLKDKVGNEAASFTDQAADATDTTPPRLEWGEIDGDVMTIYFSEALDEGSVSVGKGAGDRFRVTLDYSSYWRIDGQCPGGDRSFTTTPREVYVNGNTVVVDGLQDYEKGRANVIWTIINFLYLADAAVTHRLRDLSGNPVSTPDHRYDMVSATRVIYLENLTQLPHPKSATVVGNQLILTFSAPMHGGRVPAASAFTVMVNGSAASLASANPVAASDREVTLTLAAAVAAGDTITVSYAKPEIRPIRNMVCEYAPSFTDQAVANFTGVPPVSSIAITSDPGNDDTYGLGDTIQVTATFSEAVNVDTTTGTPRLKIKMDAGFREKSMWYESGSGTSSLVFTRKVVDPNLSSEGIAVLANSLKLNGGAIRFASSGNPAYLAHAGLHHDPNHKVD